LAALLGDYAKLIAPTFLAMIFNGAKFAANLLSLIFLTIAGGQVTGKRVEVDAQDLIIESKQDTSKANSQQFDASVQVTVGFGFSASGSLSASKAKGDYASVNEQSGILAGDGGYGVNVKNNTNLIGGIITSSQAAEDAGKNSFSTGTLTSIDVQNHADYSATGFGVGGGFAKNGTGENTNQMTPQNKNSTAQGKASLTANKSVGLGHDSGHEASTTASGINTSNLTITNTAGQAATGKSADQIKAEVATGTTTDTVALNSGHIANNYDAQAVQDEINLQVKVTQEFDKTRQGIKAEINEKEKAARDAAEQETDPVKKNELEQNANRLQNQGLLLDIVAGGLAAPTNAVGGIIASSLAPAVSYQIGQHFKDNGTEGSFSHLLAHTVLGAAVAAAGGNNALTAGLAAGGAEAAAPAVMHYLYGKDIQVNDLTAEQKSTISAIVGLGGAAIGATGSAADVTQGSMAAVNAVTNNYLTSDDDSELTSLRNKKNLTQAEKDRKLALEKEDAESNARLLKACVTGYEKDCLAERAKASAAALTYRNMTIYNQLHHQPGYTEIDGLLGITSPEGLEKMRSDAFLRQAYAYRDQQIYDLVKGTLGFLGVDGLSKETLAKIAATVSLVGIVANGKGSGSGLKTPNSQIGAIGSGVDKRLPVPEKVTASNGLGYKSNSKHTSGGSGNNPKAGIEPPNSLELFNNSIPASGDSKKRFTVDSNGHVHQFTDSNDGSFHWAGSTSDARSPLTLTNRTKADLRKAGYTSKVLK
jgi:filamentous hemagglutinin